MSRIDMVAQDVANKFLEKETKDDLNFKFDPATIMVLIEIIMEIIATIQKCREESQDEVEFATEIVNSPSRWQKILLKIKVRRTLGRKEYRKTGKNVVAALLEVGDNLTLEDMDQILEEV